MKYYNILITFIFIPFLLNGQDFSYDALKDISLKKGVTINGSFNLNSVAYQASGQEARRDPFNWFANATLNVNLFGIAAPLSFSYSNAKLIFSQPFNRLKFIPQYKWVKLHLGNGNMNFNEYTLGGHMFKGYGIELTPKKFRIMAMKGCLRDAIPYAIASPTNMSFQRNAVGILLGYTGKSWMSEWNMLSVNDDAGSIPFIPLQTFVTPQSNFCASLKMNVKPTKWMQLEFMYALSALLSDNRNNSLFKNNINTSINNNIIKLGFLSRLFPAKPGLSFYDAINVSTNFVLKNINLQLKYQRVTPGYTSLGAYYINNDIENLTIAPSFPLWKGKVNIVSNIGLQRNNLDGLKTTSNNRLVSLFNINIIPNRRWLLHSEFSNFSAFTKVRPPSDPFYVNGLDSLNFYQINNAFNQTAVYQIEGKRNKQTFSLNVNFQQTQDATGNRKEAINNNQFFASNIGYTYLYTPSDISGNLYINYNANQIQGTQSSFLGPTLTFSKAMLNKQLPMNLSLSYNSANTAGVKSGDIINARFGLTYIPSVKEKISGNNYKEKHQLRQNINCNIQYTSRMAGSSGYPFSEISINAAYSCGF